MPSPRRQCEMKVPEVLIEKMEKLPGGIRPILSKIEKEFGLATACSYSLGAKNYFIVGPNPDILELAIETLQRRYFAIEDRQSDISGEIDSGRRAVWKLQGDYAVKASQLFRSEIEHISKMRSVHIHVSPMKLEITASYDDVDKVRTKVNQLQTDVDNLLEADIPIVGSHAEIIRLREFIQRKMKYDQTVVLIFNEREEKFTVFAKTEDSLRKVMDEWTSICRNHTRAQQSSPSFSYSSNTQHPRFRSEMKIPGGIVRKLEKQPGGISYILAKVEKEFGLKVDYVRKKHLTIFGPHLDILELAAQTLIYRYVLRAPPENGVIGMLQGQNAVWKFLGSYAKKVIHLFAKDLRRLKRIRTVTVKATPCKVNPTCLEILCSVRVVEVLKSQVEKIVGLVHNLFEKEVQIPNEIHEIQRAKQIVLEKNDTGEVLCLFDDRTRKFSVSGRNEMLVFQVVVELQQWHRHHVKEEMMPEVYRNMYRHMYQMRIADDTVHKLEHQAGGIMPMMERIEKEYGVKTLFHKKKQMVLISPSVEVLELARETLESRYINENEDTLESNVTDTSVEDEKLKDASVEDETGKDESVETQNVNDATNDKRNDIPDETFKDSGFKEQEEPQDEEDLSVHTIHNRHYSPKKPRGHSSVPQRPFRKSVLKSPEKLRKNRKPKKVEFV